ncbi:hypothetical protein E4U43_005354 [Claviceps pusilla]|uniref:Uncharacterized protein n=1 Tax=Claviceps pusilla TaxID=123648 RepID=A0A9P7NEJ1_9HYPO|nr:hypothetical protein E4U43_005354 [Claviceps pusilla]
MFPTHQRGVWVYDLDQALAPLAGNSEQLSRARKRFSKSPPAYTSQSETQSGTPTEQDSPVGEEARHRMKRTVRLWSARLASTPFRQFHDQVREVKDQLNRGEINKPPGISSYTHAENIIKERWIEQGIWDDKWIAAVVGNWKHEEPQDQASSEQGPEKLPIQPSVQDLCSREASRPFYQFIYQVSKEREQIIAKQSPIDIAADINTIAYMKVKKVWIKRCIWNSKWGLMPGMTWKHEHPLDEDDDVVDQDLSEPQSCAQSPVLPDTPDPTLSPSV